MMEIRKGAHVEFGRISVELLGQSDCSDPNLVGSFVVVVVVTLVVLVIVVIPVVVVVVAVCGFPSHS